MKVASWARHQAGFTLLEVLLVAMLMGLVATAVTLSMGGARGDRELDKQARRFMATLQQAQEYSVMDGRLLGLRVEENGWQFMSRDPKDRKWRALTGDKLLGPVTLPEGMTLAVELEVSTGALRRTNARSRVGTSVSGHPRSWSFRGESSLPSC